jgi:hypothetical protein
VKKTTTTAPPRTYTFRPPEHLGFHAELTTVCPDFCDGHNGSAVEHPVDVSHSTSGQTLDLPLTSPGRTVEECAAVETFLDMRPYSLDPAQRVPHAVIAILDSTETPPLTPDAFAEAIERFAAEVEHMRKMHTVLVQAVAEYQVGA